MAQDYFDPARAVSIGGGNEDFDPGRAELIQPAGGTASDLAKSLKVGTQRLPGMVTGLADLPFALAAGARPFTKAADALGEVTGFQPGKWADETKFSAGYEQGKKAVDDAWKDGSAGDIALAYLKNPGYTANQVVESAPGMVAGGLAGRALMGVGRVAAPAARAGGVGPAVPGLAERALGQWAAPVAAGVGEGAVTAGQQMAQYQGEDQQKNALASLGAGVVTGGLGVGAGRVANKLGLETAETAIAKAGTGAAKAADDVPLSAKRRILGGMVSEALLQELPQSAQEQMWQNWADGKPLMEGVARAATEGAIAGGVMGAGANVSDGGAGKRRALAEQQAKQLSEAEAEALRADPSRAWTTEAGAVDPNQPAGERAAPPDAPELQTIPGAAGPRDGLDFTRDVDTAGLTMQDPAEVERARAATMDYEPTDTTPQWDTQPGAAEPRTGLDMPAREFDTASLGFDTRPLSERMGLDPAKGSLTRIAALAVDTGASPVQFLGATGRDMQLRQTGPGVANESNVIDVQGRVVEDRAIGTPRRLTAQDGARESGAIAFQDGVPRSEIAAIPNIVARAEQLRGYDEAAQKAAQPLALPAPSNLREGLERIRAQREQAARTAQVPPTTGAASVPQANQAQQAISQQPQAGGQAIAGPAAAPTAGPSAAPGGSGVQAAGLTDGSPTANHGAQGTPASGAQGQAPQTEVARPDGWRKSMLRAAPIASAMGIDPKGKRLAQVVAEIDARDTQTPTTPAPQPAPGPVRLGRDNTPLSEGGKPFKTRKAAGDAKKLQPMMRVVSVEGGYALAEKTPAQLAAEERASRRLRSPSTSASGEPIPAHAFIAAAGGLNRAAAADLGVEGNPRIGNRTLFAGQGRGLSIEQATQMLIQDGYLSEGALHNDAYALIKTSLTRPQYNADGIERIAQAESDARFEDYLAAQEEAAAEGDTDPFGVADSFTAEELDDVGYTDADPALQAEVNALIAQADAMGIDTYAILDDIARTYADATQDQYNAAARDALAQAIARGNQNGGSTAAQAAPAAEPAQEPGLTAPTRADIEAQQEARDKAEREEAARQRAADQAASQDENRKRIAQASVRAAAEFELGQDPLDSLTGQGGLMFSRKAGESGQEGVERGIAATIEKAVQQWQVSLRNAASNPEAKEPGMATPAVLRIMGAAASRLVLPRTYLRAIMDKHGDVPASVFENLPALLADPLFIIPHKDGGLRVFVESKTAKGEPIAVGVSVGVDGRIHTVTPLHDHDGMTGQGRMARAVVTATSRIYAKNKEALAKAKASAEASPGTIPLQRNSNGNGSVITRADVVKRIAQGTKPGDPRFSFAGARAATADTHALVTAQDRLDAGEDPETVRQETGWFKGVDGRMRFEISDADALLKADTSGAEGRRTIGQMFPLGYYGDEVGLTVGRMLHHPALFAAYPAIADIKVKMVYDLRGDDVKGSFNPSTNTITLNQNASWRDAMSTLLHEIQHGIQNIEGFAMGDSPERLAKTMPDVQAINDAKLLARFMERGESAFDARQRFTRYMGRDPNPQGVYLAERNEPNEIARMASTPLDAYKRNAGEVEARNTQARQKLTADQRRATSPGSTADVADADVIVVFNGKEMANAPMPANAVPDASATVQPLRTPAATIRASIAKAYGKLLGQLESKGLVTLTQTQEQAIEAAAQARADKTGGDVAQIRQSLMAAVKRSIASDGDVSEQIYQEIAADEDVIDALELWMVDGKEPDSETNRKLLSYMGRMPAIPADSYLTFYRGQPVGVRPHKRGWASWTTSRDTTRNFIGRNGEVLERKGVQGVSLEQIALWRTRLTGELHDYGSQGEWIVLNDSAFGASPSTIDIRRSANGAVQGFFDPQTGQSFLIADNLTAEAAPGVLMHEVGIHMAADGSMKALFNRAAMMLKMQRGNPFIKAVQARMDAAGETSGEEAAAYIAEAYENDRANAPASVQRWLADLLAAVKAWMFKKGIMGADRLTVADIAAVARANARSMARDGGATGGQGFGPAFSHAPAGDQTQTENFRRWFAGSKVVDAEGKPLRVYHGTTADVQSFTQDTPGSASGYATSWLGTFFSSDADAANSYTRRLNGLSLQYEFKSGANVVPAYLVIEKPYLMSVEEFRGIEGDPGAVTRMRSKLERLGHDGIALGDGETWVAFKPTQIKSAIGNNGNFDPSNPDIRFSRAVSPSQPAAWDAPTPTGFDDVIYKLQDKNIDLKRVVESISKATGKVSDSINAYLKEELFHKRAAKRVADFGDRELKPLMNKMRLAGLSMEDVEEYLHARHAKEANAVIAQRNPGNAGLQDGGSGMTNAAADNYFAKLDPAQRRKLEAVAKSVDAIIEGTRKLYVDYGLEDQAVVDGWANMYQHYIPLMREDKDGGMGIGQGFSVKGKETKGRTGSTRKVVDILANVAMQREKLIVRGEKNIVAQALVGLAQANPNPDFWEVRSQAPTERVFDPKTGVVVDRPDPLFKSRENVAVAKVKDANGKVTEQMVVFNEDNPRAVRMAAAMKNLDAGNLEGLLGVSAKITRYFAAINTQYNPVFGVVNLVRDVQGAMVNLGTTPLAGQQGKIAKDTLSALRGIYGDIRKTRKGGQATSQWSQLWEQMQDDGGTTGYRDLFKTSADRANDLKSILNPEGWMDSKWGKFFTADGRLKVPLSMAQKGATEIFGWLSDYNEAMENGVRLAAYKAALDKGMSREQAASLAKNLTVNFNRKGQAGMQAGAVYAFFNAAMQGTARIGQTLFDMDGGDVATLRLSKTGKAVVYGGVMLGVMQALALSAAGFDDDDPPEFVRERSFIIPTGDKTYVSIPMPLGLHVIPGIGRHATEFALSGFDKPAKRAVSMVGMFADAFNPIGNAGLSMQTIAPTALDPLVALSENKDWTGKPIARVSSNKALPGHTQWKDTATGFSKVVAEGINWISGGNEYVAGAFSPTPDQIDYLLAQVGGGVAREAAKVQQTITTAMSGETLPTHKIPLVGRFVGNAASQASQGSAFYANLNKLNELETEIKGLRKDGRFDEASKLTRENPQSMMIAMANRAERDVQRLRREKRELIANDASREQVRAKEDQITDVMTRLNEAVERRKAQAAR